MPTFVPTPAPASRVNPCRASGALAGRAVAAIAGAWPRPAPVQCARAAGAGHWRQKRAQCRHRAREGVGKDFPDLGGHPPRPSQCGRKVNVVANLMAICLSAPGGGGASAARAQEVPPGQCARAAERAGDHPGAQRVAGEHWPQGPECGRVRARQRAGEPRREAAARRAAAGAMGGGGGRAPVEVDRPGHNKCADRPAGRVKSRDCAAGRPS